ncbi:hypothetical protein HY382_03045 [Candidatus Curtissbacteria bacterium]|nr:hypothetical protein [Candidatus Curtissbacteria bacterium]
MPDTEEQKIIDKTVEKVLNILGKNPAARKIQSSQILTGIFGVIGFALFIKGVEKYFIELPSYFLITLGIIMMALAGVVLQKISK